MTDAFPWDEAPHHLIRDRDGAFGPPYTRRGEDPVRAYLDIEELIEAAKTNGCDCVHPGYGFLSENPGFAERYLNDRLTFIGDAV
jgi:pyruvate carboxylase